MREKVRVRRSSSQSFSGASASLWIWSGADETLGLDIDPETGQLSWYADVGSFCGDDEGFARQSPASYERAGPPARVGNLPPDVQEGIRRALDEHLLREISLVG